MNEAVGLGEEGVGLGEEGVGIGEEGVGIGEEGVGIGRDWIWRLKASCIIAQGNALGRQVQNFRRL
jgi:hypothetical protein